MIDYIKVERLLEFVNFPFVWDDIVVTLEDVKKMIDVVDEQIENFPDNLMDEIRLNKQYTKEWHVGRIKYFVNNPNKITPISIDNDCSSGDISGVPIIIDGHHRLMATIIRRDKVIPSYYSGLIDTLDYLKS